jgi:hypothetical protein
MHQALKVAYVFQQGKGFLIYKKCYVPAWYIAKEWGMLDYWTKIAVYCLGQEHNGEDPLFNLENFEIPTLNLKPATELGEDGVLHFDPE